MFATQLIASCLSLGFLTAPPLSPTPAVSPKALSLPAGPKRDTNPLLPSTIHLEEYRRARAHAVTRIVFGYGGFTLAFGMSLLALTTELDAASAEEHDDDGTGESTSNVGRVMWPLAIPLVGPFVTAARSPTASGSLLATVDGLAQVGGVVLGTFAVVKLHRLNRRYSFSMGPAATGHGASFSLQF